MNKLVCWKKTKGFDGWIWGVIEVDGIHYEGQLKEMRSG